MLSFGFTNTTATTHTSGGITTPAPKKTINIESNKAVTPGSFGPGINQTQQHFAVPKPQVASTPSINVTVVKTPAPQIAATPLTNVPFAKAKVAVFNNNQRKRPSSATSSTSSTSGSTNSGTLKSRSSFMNNNGNHGNHGHNGNNGNSDKRRRTTTSVLNKRLNPNAVEPSQHSSLLTNVSRRKRAPPAAPAPAFITNPNPSNRRRLAGAFTSSSSSNGRAESLSHVEKNENNVEIENITARDWHTKSRIKDTIFTAADDDQHLAHPQLQRVFAALLKGIFENVVIDQKGYNDRKNWWDWWNESDITNQKLFLNVCTSIFE